MELADAFSFSLNYPLALRDATENCHVGPFFSQQRESSCWFFFSRKKNGNRRHDGREPLRCWWLPGLGCTVHGRRDLQLFLSFEGITRHDKDPFDGRLGRNNINPPSTCFVELVYHAIDLLPRKNCSWLSGNLLVVATNRITKAPLVAHKFMDWTSGTWALKKSVYPPAGASDPPDWNCTAAPYRVRLEKPWITHRKWTLTLVLMADYDDWGWSAVSVQPEAAWRRTPGPFRCDCTAYF